MSEIVFWLEGTMCSIKGLAEKKSKYAPIAAAKKSINTITADNQLNFFFSSEIIIAICLKLSLLNNLIIRVYDQFKIENAFIYWVNLIYTEGSSIHYSDIGF